MRDVSCCLGEDWRWGSVRGKGLEIEVGLNCRLRRLLHSPGC